MLGKLIKYDLKSVSGVLCLIHGALLILTLGVRMTLLPYMNDITDAESVLSILLTTVLIVALVGASYATYIFICVRFYKNVYSDEGYLTNTLPVTSGQLLLSKTISGSIWTSINIVFVFLSLYLAFIQPVYQTLTDTERSLFVFTDSGFAALFIFSMLLSVVSEVVMLYFSIILGQFFKAHRILGAIASYFLLNTVISILGVIALLITEGGSALFAPTTESTMLFIMESMSGFFLVIDILMAIVTAACYFASLYFMKKKRNLV